MHKVNSFFCWRQTRTGWIKTWLGRFGHGYKPMTHGSIFLINKHSSSWLTNQVHNMSYNDGDWKWSFNLFNETGGPLFKQQHGTLKRLSLENMAVYHLAGKSFRKTWLDSKRNTTSWVVPGENFGGQPNIWKGSPVFPDGMYQTKISAPFLIPVSDFRGRFSVNGNDLY